MAEDFVNTIGRELLNVFNVAGGSADEVTGPSVVEESQRVFLEALIELIPQVIADFLSDDVKDVSAYSAQGDAAGMCNEHGDTDDDQ